MSRLNIKPGTKHRLTRRVIGHSLQEPVGDPHFRLDWRSSFLEKGAVVTAGITCIYTDSPGRTLEAQWFYAGPETWHLFTLRPGQTLLQPIDTHPPMGALVVDDMSGDDICADV